MTKSYLDNVNESIEMKKAYLYHTGESTRALTCRQVSATYKFIRSMPQLAVYGYRIRT